MYILFGISSLSYSFSVSCSIQYASIAAAATALVLAAAAAAAVAVVAAATAALSLVQLYDLPHSHHVHAWHIYAFTWKRVYSSISCSSIVAVVEFCSKKVSQSGLRLLRVW